MDPPGRRRLDDSQHVGECGGRRERRDDVNVIGRTVGPKHRPSPVAEDAAEVRDQTRHRLRIQERPTVLRRKDDVVVQVRVGHGSSHRPFGAQGHSGLAYRGLAPPAKSPSPLRGARSPSSLSSPIAPSGLKAILASHTGGLRPRLNPERPFGARRPGRLISRMFRDRARHGTSPRGCPRASSAGDCSPRGG